MEQLAKAVHVSGGVLKAEETAKVIEGVSMKGKQSRENNISIRGLDE